MKTLLCVALLVCVFAAYATAADEQPIAVQPAEEAKADEGVLKSDGADLKAEESGWYGGRGFGGGWGGYGRGHGGYGGGWGGYGGGYGGGWGGRGFGRGGWGGGYGWGR